jgi:carbamoyl-phosphate synthase large subunit
MKDIVVGVSGINAGDNPGAGIGVARSLKEDEDLKVKVIGLAYDAMETGLYMDWLIDRAFMMPYPAVGHAEYLERLKHIQQSCGLNCLIPCLDAELPLFTKYSGELENLGIRTFLPSPEQFRLRSKDRLKEVAETIGILYPESELVNSHQDLNKALESLGLPVMVKGAFYKAYYAHTPQEAAANYDRIMAEWGGPVIIQKIVTGEEMNVVGVGDGRGGSLGRVGIKKLTVTALGKIWNGVTIKHQMMLEAADRFIASYKWRGGFELECIVDGSDIYLIEINPRLPAWTYFATAVGVNLPSQIVRAAMNEPAITPREYETGRLFIRYTDEMITDMDLFQKVTLRGER